MAPTEKERRMYPVSASVVEPDVVTGVGPSTIAVVDPLSPTMPDVVRSCHFMSISTSVGATLARNVIPYLAGCPVSVSKQNETAIYLTFLRIAQELLSNNAITFEQTLHMLRMSPQSGTEGQAVYNAIMDQMLNDGVLNWGRVITIYAFTAYISKAIYVKTGSKEAVNEYISYLEQYVDKNLEHRIQSSLCGWDSLPAHFPEKQNIEKQIWTGLMGTLMGLGICSLAIIAVR